MSNSSLQLHHCITLRNTPQRAKSIVFLSWNWNSKLEKGHSNRKNCPNRSKVHILRQTKSHGSFAPIMKFFLTSPSSTTTETMSSYIVKIKCQLSWAVLMCNRRQRLHSHEAELWHRGTQPKANLVLGFIPPLKHQLVLSSWKLFQCFTD